MTLWLKSINKWHYDWKAKKKTLWLKSKKRHYDWKAKKKNDIMTEKQKKINK